MKFLRQIIHILAISVASSGLVGHVFAQYTPTISGSNAVWWLGAGIIGDGECVAVILRPVAMPNPN